MGWFKKEPYEVEVICINCKTELIIEIPKGTKVYDWLKKKKSGCAYCGCTDMKWLCILWLY